MAQQRWQSGVQRDDVFVSPDMVFQKIDDARGNGICAGPKGIKRKQDLIIEGALISSVLNKVRFPNLINEKTNNNDPNPVSPPRYCSICCCFIGTPREEFNRLRHFLQLHSKVNHNTSNNKSKSDLDFDAFDAVASSAGFNAQDHPRWFFNNNIVNCNDNIYASHRCHLCQQTRCLVPELPQTLEEVGLFIQNALLVEESQDNKKSFSLLWKSFSKLISLTKYFDEGLFGITRAILMLVDEVVGGCERVTKVQQKMKSGNWIVSVMKKTKGSATRKDALHVKIFKQPMPQLFPKNHKSKQWRVNRLLSIVAKKAAKIRKSNDRKRYFSREDLLVATEEETQSSQQQLFTIFQYSQEIRHRINFFCSCFDPGMRPAHSTDDLVQYQKAMNLMNDVISGVATYFYPSLGKTPKSFRFLTVPQILTLRCCLQNNQHRSLIPNPFNVFIENYQDDVSATKHRISNNNNIKKPVSTNKSSSKTSSSSLPIKSKNEKQLEENAKICIREIKKLMCHPLMMSEEEEELLNQGDSDSSNNDESESDDDEDASVKLTVRPVVTIEAQALFVNTSRLNHCCNPVACVQPASTVRGAALRVSTLASVKPGQEIRISYVELEEVEKSKKKVHRYLKKQYGFDCED